MSVIDDLREMCYDYNSLKQSARERVYTDFGKQLVKENKMQECVCKECNNYFIYPLGSLVYFQTDSVKRVYQVTEHVTTKLHCGEKHTYTVESMCNSVIDSIENVYENQLELVKE